MKLRTLLRELYAHVSTRFLINFAIILVLVDRIVEISISYST